jgi:cytochrome bd-type quinol oxidase subunit 1
MITDSEYRKIGVGVFKVGAVAFAIGVLTGYLIFN